jgi:hypothetical protein
LLIVLLLAGALLVPAAHAAVAVTLVPSWPTVEPGAEFDVSVMVSSGGSEFNGFDLVMAFDHNLLTYVGQPVAGRPGQLVTAACQRSPFHVFSTAPDSSSLNVSYVMLCAGVVVSGPGAIYNLRFRAGQDAGLTGLTLLPGTRFFNAGIVVEATITDGKVYVGQSTPVPGVTAAAKPSLQAVPNPFNPSTRIVFSLPEPGAVTVAVYDPRGRLVRALWNGHLAAGEASLVWDGRDDTGARQSAGVYLCALTYPYAAKRLVASRKLVLVP